jgi:hypothetical protein
MAFDLDMIKGEKTRIRVKVARKEVGQPLTLKRFLL